MKGRRQVRTPASLLARRTSRRRSFWHSASQLRTWLAGAALLFLFLLLYWLAFLLRFDFVLPAEWSRFLLLSAPWVVAVKLGVFLVVLGSPAQGRNVSFDDLLALLRATLFSLATLALIDHFIAPGQIPRAVLIMDAMLTVLVCGGWQSVGRWMRERVHPVVHPGSARPALLVVSDEATGLIARQINSHANLDFRVTALVTSHVRLLHQRFGSVRVIGHIRDIGKLAAVSDAECVLVVAGSVPGRRMRWLMKACKSEGLELKIIPPPRLLFSGDDEVPLRDLEIGDLLRRPTAQLDSEAIGELLSGKRVLVTGAGGSIGSEICRQLIRYRPSELTLLGRGENRIFKIEAELRRLNRGSRIRSTIGSVTDAQRMRELMETARPEVVFHAAAHKHVPLMEQNIAEAITNNVGGTKTLADLADEFDVKKFVSVSTDKAVNPTSVMGSTKQLAERYIRHVSRDSATNFVSVRFGNVLGSSGSVVRIFQEQIRKGGPITVTDPRMTRFFMTIPEASGLVLQAGAMGDKGEIFVLDMGQPVKIVDLARDLIQLSGLSQSAVDIRVTGVRPGEKLYEELYGTTEEQRTTTHPEIHLAAALANEEPDFEQRLLDLLDQSRRGDGYEVLFERLCALVHNFQPGSRSVGSSESTTSITEAGQAVR